MPLAELTSRLEYELTYSKRRKTIAITVDRQGLSVTAPEGTPPEEIEQLLARKEGWIRQKLRLMSQVLPAPPPKEFVSGERLTYIGRSYRLQVNEGDTVSFRYHRGSFIAQAPKPFDRERIRQKAVEWYRSRALAKFSERVEFYAPKVGKHPKEIRVRDFKARWGSCQPDGTIDLNWKLVMAPMSAIDYVVVHELCHLVFRDHSRGFWNRMAAVMPDHGRRREWLRIHGAQLDF